MLRKTRVKFEVRAGIIFVLMVTSPLLMNPKPFGYEQSAKAISGVVPYPPTQKVGSVFVAGGQIRRRSPKSSESSEAWYENINQ